MSLDVTIHDLPIAIYKYTARKTFSKKYENMECDLNIEILRKF